MKKNWVQVHDPEVERDEKKVVTKRRRRKAKKKGDEEKEGGGLHHEGEKKKKGGKRNKQLRQEREGARGKAQGEAPWPDPRPHSGLFRVLRGALGGYGGWREGTGTHAYITFRFVKNNNVLHQTNIYLEGGNNECKRNISLEGGNNECRSNTSEVSTQKKQLRDITLSSKYSLAGGHHEEDITDSEIKKLTKMFLQMN